MERERQQNDRILVKAERVLGRPADAPACADHKNCARSTAESSALAQISVAALNPF